MSIIISSGLTASSGYCGMIGPTGSVGGPGIPGPPGIPVEYKEYMFLCKKDFGFFKSGDYITMLLNSHLFGPLELKSKDSLMSFSISRNELDEHFIWGEELRDKHIVDILNYSTDRQI
jgi:hypothetical protein